MRRPLGAAWLSSSAALRASHQTAANVARPAVASPNELEIDIHGASTNACSAKPAAAPHASAIGFSARVPPASCTPSAAARNGTARQIADVSGAATGPSKSAAASGVRASDAQQPITAPRPREESRAFIGVPA